MANTGISPSAQQRLSTLEQRLRSRFSEFLGFPASRDFEYADLRAFDDILINNVGDPYVAPLSDFHSKEFECEVIDFFAKQWRAPANNYWGYITSGGTEANLYGMYAARELYPGAILYHSTAAHYSVPKSAHLLGLKAVAVPAQPNGEVDYDALQQAVIKRADRPAIVVANIGTTMTEAKDDVSRIKQTLQNVVPSRHYIHSDAALAGAYASFIDPHIPFDFEDGSDSISVSGHKFIGMPFPSGLVVTKRTHHVATGKHISYIAAPDTTISGSRSGHAALFFWYALQRFGEDGLRERYHVGRKLAVATMQKLNTIGWEAWANPHALTVVMRSPSASILTKWQLANDGGWSHIICMPGISPEHIDACIAQIATENKR